MDSLTIKCVFILRLDWQILQHLIIAPNANKKESSSCAEIPIKQLCFHRKIARDPICGFYCLRSSLVEWRSCVVVVVEFFVG